MMKAVTAWWTSREAREQMLIATALILSFLIGLYQFGWVPAKAYRVQGAQAYSTALSDNVAVREATRSAVPNREIRTSRDPLQLIVTETSAYYGLAVTRMLPDESGGLNLWLDNVPSGGLYPWLAELEREHALRVEKATVRLIDSEARVNANVFIRRVE
ncbi:MAG: type II secretion system protein M [Hyphomonadaceae bacterium]|nr:type II secretion system protein M [Hyphomonadaceae bacterium]